MKLTFLILILFLASTTIGRSQEISQAMVKIAKVERNCIKADYPYSTDVISDALSDKIKSAGLGKGSKVKGGFRVYKGVNIPEISEDKIDLYTCVACKNESSTLYVAVSKGYDNFVTAETDPEMLDKAIAYVNSMESNVNIAKLKVDIADQAKVVNKMEKEKETNSRNGNKLKNEQENLEDKLTANKKDQEKNKKDLNEAEENLQQEISKLNDLKSTLEMMVK